MSNMYLEKLVEQLNALNGSLKAVKDQESFDISNWITPEQNVCGYAACILGHHVIQVNEFKPEVRGKLHKHTYNTIQKAAVEYACVLDSMCDDLTDSTDLVKSIYMSGSSCRTSLAVESDMFDEDETEDIPHLAKSDPSISDAIDYINLCIQKLEAEYGHDLPCK